MRMWTWTVDAGRTPEGSRRTRWLVLRLRSVRVVLYVTRAVAG